MFKIHVDRRKSVLLFLSGSCPWNLLFAVAAYTGCVGEALDGNKDLLNGGVNGRNGSTVISIFWLSSYCVGALQCLPNHLLAAVAFQ